MKGLNLKNQFLLPNFLCPWVCSEFIHKFGYVDLDNVIKRSIQKYNLSIDDVSKLSKIEHTQDDYLQKSNNDYGTWLHNTDWKVLPTISFVDVYPRVLACKDHNGRFNQIHIHCCRWITKINSSVSNQFFTLLLNPEPRSTRNFDIILLSIQWYNNVVHGKVQILSMYQVLEILITVLF